LLLRNDDDDNDDIKGDRGTTDKCDQLLLDVRFEPDSGKRTLTSVFGPFTEILSIISRNLKTSRDRDHAHARIVCNLSAKASHGEPMYKI